MLYLETFLDSKKRQVLKVFVPAGTYWRLKEYLLSTESTFALILAENDHCILGRAMK